MDVEGTSPGKDEVDHIGNWWARETQEAKSEGRGEGSRNKLGAKHPSSQPSTPQRGTEVPLRGEGVKTKSPPKGPGSFPPY